MPKITDFATFLKQEMLRAFGCTEPISIALCAARVSNILNIKNLADLKSMEVICSANIIKNVKSVIIPNSGGKKSIEVAAALGFVSKSWEKKLEVLENITDEMREYAWGILPKIKVGLQKGVSKLFIKIIAKTQNNTAVVIIENEHANIAFESLNDRVLKDTRCNIGACEYELCFDEIYEWAKNGDIGGVIDVLKQQIDLNLAIAKEGMNNDYGANIGKMVFSMGGAKSHIIAHAAAGSDARMSGCSLPVVVNSGSGNQGIAVCVPLVLYAKDIKADENMLYRCLAFANLCSFYLKSGIGKLSAYCGVVSAASASMCGIAMLDGAPKSVIEQTLINSLAISSGMICDGAKPSCAGKIASALNTAFMAYEQAKSGNNFNFGDGIIKKDLKSTIDAISVVAKEGMGQTDIVILEQMIKD